MIKKIMYMADDGKPFETEEDCLSYELAQISKEAEQVGIYFFSYSTEQAISFEELITHDRSLGAIYIANFSKKLYDKIELFMSDYLSESFPTATDFDLDFFKEGKTYLLWYDNSEMEWRELFSERGELSRIISCYADKIHNNQRG